jgi:PAT family beta-lactamase induction signal transducer AmpG
MSTKAPSIGAALFNRRIVICIFTGFSSGMPLYLLFNLLPAWLRTEGLGLKEIGLFALIQFPYTWKFLWAPLLDRFTLPAFGRRRGWMLTTQVGLLAVIAALGTLGPKEQLSQVIWLTVTLAVLSATQDVVLDAYRRELLKEEELGLGNAFHVNAYKLSSFIPGALSLVLADHLPWNAVFFITALFMLPGVGLTLAIKELPATPPRTLRDAVVEPFREFFSRQGPKTALLILSFMLLYKLGDYMCTALATPFYLDMGFSKTEIGLVAKNAGLWPSIAGGFVGGLWMVRLGIHRALWVFGAIQLLTILGFAWLAFAGPRATIGSADLALLALVIGLEAFGSVGLATSAFVAFIAKTTSPKYTATQFALFTSLMAVPRTFLAASVGYIVEQIGWFQFFLFCTLLAVPGMLLLFKVAPWREAARPSQAS